MAVRVPRLVAGVEPGRGAPDVEVSVLVGGVLIGGSGSSQTSGGPESKASAFKPASTRCGNPCSPPRQRIAVIVGVAKPQSVLVQPSDRQL